MSHSIDLSGKVVLITGASQGIGAQMARTFQAAGGTVILNHPGIGSTGDDAQAMADELNALRPGSASVIAANVADTQAVDCRQRITSSVDWRVVVIVFNIREAALQCMPLASDPTYNCVCAVIGLQS